MFSMAREATLLVQTGFPIMFTCANGTGIEKGAILTLSDYMTAATCAADDDMVAGICAAEKIADNGEVKVAVHREGIFKVTLSGTCAAGDPLATNATSLSNTVYSVVNTTALSGSKIIGIALEAGANTNTIKMDLRPSFGTGA